MDADIKAKIERNIRNINQIHHFLVIDRIAKKHGITADDFMEYLKDKDEREGENTAKVSA